MYNFRLDRFLTLYFFHPIIKLSFHNDLRIPILMYHSISEDIENGVHPYYQINTSPVLFAEHMKYLHNHNYSVINLTDMTKLFETRNKVISKYVVLTFDDGYHDFYNQAFPILNKYNFTATVYLPTGSIENQSLKLKGKDHLNWNEIRELLKRGIVFGSHSVTHPQLSLLRKEDTEYEIRKSKEAIEEKTGERVDSFSYPFKFPEELKYFTQLLSDVLKKYGYRYGVSTRIGRTYKNDDIYFRKRIPINSQDDLSLFKAKIEGGYDWLYHIQKLFKHRFSHLF